MTEISVALNTRVEYGTRTLYNCFVCRSYWEKNVRYNTLFPTLVRNHACVYSFPMTYEFFSRWLAAVAPTVYTAGCRCILMRTSTRRLAVLQTACIIACVPADPAPPRRVTVCLPRRLVTSIPIHWCRTARYYSMEGLKNHPQRCSRRWANDYSCRCCL